jgi:citrate synthase
LPEGIVRLLRSLPAAEPMDLLRTLVSALAHYDADAADNSPRANARKAVRLTAQIGSIVATLGRVDAGGGPLHPDPAMGFAASFLYMLTGRRPDALSARALDVALVLHADHELNASTFAARVAAATLTDVHSAVVAGIGTLKGPLHGGANAEVMKMLLDLGVDATPDRIERTIREKLARKEKIPGFGHRVYRTMDPRAVHLRQMSRDLSRRTGQPQWFEISERIEALVKGDKGLNPNVDFYSASTYHALGIPATLFTPVFAVSRCAGWTAHVLEQLANNRLIRPRAEYTGPSVPQPWVRIDAR